MNIKNSNKEELNDNDPRKKIELASSLMKLQANEPLGENDKGLIYILKVRDGIYKLKYMSKNKTKKYKLPIVFIFKIDYLIKEHIDEIKDNLGKYKYKNKTRTYKIDLELLKSRIKYSCDIMS
jgi:hypothetical protein